MKNRGVCGLILFINLIFFGLVYFEMISLKMGFYSVLVTTSIGFVLILFLDKTSLKGEIKQLVEIYHKITLGDFQAKIYPFKDKFLQQLSKYAKSLILVLTAFIGHILSRAKLLEQLSDALLKKQKK